MSNQAKQAYSFPILRGSEILLFMSELKVKLTEAELSEPDKHKESIRRVYEQLVDLCLNISREEMNQPAFSGLSVLSYPQLHEDSIPQITFLRACTKMMKICGVSDFSARDLSHPESKRVRKHLSAVINFARFRDERLSLYSELTTKRDGLVDALVRMEEEEEKLQADLEILEGQTAEDAQKINETKQICEDQVKQLEEYNNEQAILTEQSQEMKKTSQELKEKSNNLTLMLKESRTELDRVKGQIVHSPQRVRQEMASAAKDVEQERQEGMQTERSAREMQLMVATVARTQAVFEKVSKALKDFGDEVEKKKNSGKEVKELQKKNRRTSHEIDNATIEESNLKKQIQRIDDRCENIRNQAKSKMEEIEKNCYTARSALVEAEKEKKSALLHLEDLESEVKTLVAIFEEEKKTAANKQEEMIQSLSSLQQVVEHSTKNLHDVLQSN